MPEAHLLSQRSLQDAPIFRLLLKVAVKGTHQCDYSNFWGSFGLPTTMVYAVVTNQLHSARSTCLGASVPSNVLGKGVNTSELAESISLPTG